MNRPFKTWLQWLMAGPKNLSPYQASDQRSRSRSWYAPTIGPNQALSHSLTTLINRSRAAIRNDPYANQGIRLLVSNLVGTGIKPNSQAQDEVTRDTLQSLFNDWISEADSTQQLDFYGLQSQICRAWLEAGECFVRLITSDQRNTHTVPLQLQVLESEFIPMEYNDVVAQGHQIKCGIEFNPQGQRVAYWVYPQHPNDLPTIHVNTLTRIPAEQMLHIYEPLRPGQLRGQPVLTPILTRLYHLDKFDDATLIRQEIANCFTGFITKPAPEMGQIDPLTGQPIEYDEQGLPLIEMTAGTMQELAPGEDVKFTDPPGVGADYAPYMRQQLLAAAAGMGLPYELLSGDMQNISDRALRVILNEFRRRIKQLQHHILIHQFCQKVWSRWLALAQLANAIDLPNKADQRVKWIPQGWAYIHPVQDVQAQQLAVKAGFKSRSEVVSESGSDVERVDEDNCSDQQRAQHFKLQYDIYAPTANTQKRLPDQEPESTHY